MANASEETMEKGSAAAGVLIPLSERQKHAATIGCVCLMLSVTMFGVGFFVIQGPLLAEMNASGSYSLLTILASLGLAIMTPIGGKLGDLFGRRNIIVISGMICAACGIAMGIVRSVIPFFLLRLVLGAAQGAFTAAPYILMREIHRPEDAPRFMGYLASAVAAGSFGGSIVLGALADAGLLGVAIMVSVIPLFLGVFLIASNIPNRKTERKAKIDIPGILWLTVLLNAFCLSMNYGPIVGWTDIRILLGLVLAAITLAVFIKTENRASEPIVPMYLFENRYYTALLAVSFLCYCYQTAMNAYAPLAVQQIMGASATASGSLQLPRTVLTMILPAAAGAWIGKKKQHLWQAMALASGLIAAAYIPLCFTSPSTPVFVYTAALSLTGIAESFRSVSVTPAAQATLSPNDLGVGTSLIAFANSLSGLFSAAVCSVIYGMTPDSVQAGINHIHMFTVAASLAGLLIVILIVRPAMNDAARSTVHPSDH